jgi:hypothetical protein
MSDEADLAWRHGGMPIARRTVFLPLHAPMELTVARLRLAERRIGVAPTEPGWEFSVRLS